MKFTFNAKKYRCRMQAAGTPVPAHFEPMLVQMDGREVETVCGDYDGNTLDYGFVGLIPNLPIKVELIDCDENITSDVVDKPADTVLSMESGNVRLSFVNLGEGYNGDYNPDDPEDCNLLRLDIYLLSPFSDEFEEEGSVCTLMDAKSAPETLEKALETALDFATQALASKQSVKMVTEELSYLSDDNIGMYERKTADLHIRRYAYQRFQMCWLMEHGITMEDISNEAKNWMEEYCDGFDHEDGYPSFESYVAEYGFCGGEIYPCFEEFVQSEFYEEGFMLFLLPKEKHYEYLRSLGVEARFLSPDETEKQAEERVSYVRYWSNSCGELHHFGEYDITEDELPADLRGAYHTLWREDYEQLCYLVETADGKKGVALVREYDEAEFEKAKRKAAMLAIDYEDAATIVLLEGSGYKNGSELIAIVPVDGTDAMLHSISQAMNG